MFKGYDVASYLETLLQEVDKFGPWENMGDHSIYDVDGNRVGELESEDDARFVVAVRNNLGNLLMELYELRDIVAAHDDVD